MVTVAITGCGFLFLAMAKILTYCIFLLFISCNNQSELQKLCKQIRKAPQTAFPAGNDKKWKLIRKLEEIDDKDLPDSVKNIFAQIDTSIRGYSEYWLPLLNVLGKPDSRKSLQVMAGIYAEHYISDPSCSQALSNWFFMANENLVNLAISYFTKKDVTNYKGLLKNADVMFPALAGILGKRPFTDRPVFDILTTGIKAGVLNKNNLASSKPDFIRYYGYLKYVRDTLTKQQTKEYLYDGYYESHLPDLVLVLKIFEPDEEITRILKECGQQATGE